MTQGFIDRGYGRFTHHKGDRYSHMTTEDQSGATPIRSLAVVVADGYNSKRKSKSFQVNRESRRPSLLDPLLENRIVLLEMEQPKRRFHVKQVNESTTEKRAVIVTPGSLIGLPRGTVLVSVVGKGCVAVDPKRETSVAKLVLAGIPASLAKALVVEINHAFSE